MNSKCTFQTLHLNKGLEWLHHAIYTSYSRPSAACGFGLVAAWHLWALYVFHICLYHLEKIKSVSCWHFQEVELCICNFWVIANNEMNGNFMEIHWSKGEFLCIFHTKKKKKFIDHNHKEQFLADKKIEESRKGGSSDLCMTLVKGVILFLHVWFSFFQTRDYKRGKHRSIEKDSQISVCVNVCIGMNAVQCSAQAHSGQNSSWS